MTEDLGVKNKKIDEILTKVSELFGVEVIMIADDQQKLIARFEVDAIISKLLALCIYNGGNVPSSFGPPYNRVHADIEYWKKKLETEEGA